MTGQLVLDLEGPAGCAHDWARYQLDHILRGVLCNQVVTIACRRCGLERRDHIHAEHPRD